MKKTLIILLFVILLFPVNIKAENIVPKPIGAVISESDKTAVLSWKNPDNISDVILFRSTIPIANYFSFEAVDGLCDKIYEGSAEAFTDENLAINLPYYYILFSKSRAGNYSEAVVLQKKPVAKTEKNEPKNNINNNSLAGASSAYVNQVSLSEAGIVYNFNGNAAELARDDNSKRLALFIIVKSPHDLSEKDKNAISYFIHAGTATTILLGTGERAGVLNSYLSVFEKLPRNTLEWQDVIKIANGRWPEERSVISEEKAANTHFSAIYERKPDMNNPKDNAAVTVIAYGLRPANRNMESEKQAIQIYRSIFGKSPTEATDWDLVRAIAYSGATR